MAISHLPEPRLVDAAHIFIDANDRLEQPVISDGLTVSEDPFLTWMHGSTA